MEQQYDQVIELASVTAAAGGDAVTGSEVRLPEIFSNGVQFTLQVSAAAAAEGDFLDVWVQTRIGDVWYDVCNFHRRLGSETAPLAQLMSVFTLSRIVGGAMVLKYTISTALAAEADDIREVFGDGYRVKYQVTDAGAAAGLFSFKVLARAI